MEGSSTATPHRVQVRAGWLVPIQPVQYHWTEKPPAKALALLPAMPAPKPVLTALPLCCTARRAGAAIDATDVWPRAR